MKKTFDITILKECTKLIGLYIDANVTLIWREEAIPKKEDLSPGLQEHYTRILISE